MTGAVALMFSFVSGFVSVFDPYYEMNASNLNTMNSYIIPVQSNIDPTNYEDRKYQLYLQNGKVTMTPNFDGSHDDDTTAILGIHIMSSYFGYLIELLIMICIIICVRFFPWKGFSILFVSLYEGIFNFFEDIIGKEKPDWMKWYVTNLFIIILIANLFWLFNDVIRFFFPRWLRNVTAVTWELEFNMALAISSVVITLGIQSRHLWFRNCLHEYFPIMWKWLIEGKGIWAKIGDIVISIFVAFLDIVGTFAKVISLSMRLFGNMSSGGILLNVAFLWLWGITLWIFGLNLPLVIPIVVYVQGLLVAVVQAFVFSLLTAIFIKMTLD